MTITPQSHPHIFAAFREIDYDNGMVNRLEPEREAYEVPRGWEFALSTAERDLAKLDAEELKDLCIEDSIRQSFLRVKHRFSYLTTRLLNAYFDNWEETT